MIDKMFQQEILNAKLRKDYWVRFRLYDISQCCCCSDKIKLLLPNKGGRPKKIANEKIKYVSWSKKQKELLLELFDENNKRTDFNYIQNILLFLIIIITF